MTFRVGQKVVCVNHGNLPGQRGQHWDKGEEIFRGRVYTIKRVFSYRGKTNVELCEVKRTRRATIVCGHAGYAHERFRPIVERKTDITFAHEILRKASRKQGAHA